MARKASTAINDVHLYFVHFLRERFNRVDRKMRLRSLANKLLRNSSLRVKRNVI